MLPQEQGDGKGETSFCRYRQVRGGQEAGVKPAQPRYGKDDDACTCHWQIAGKAHAEDDSESGYRTFSRRFFLREGQGEGVKYVRPKRAYFFGPKSAYGRGKK